MASEPAEGSMWLQNLVDVELIAGRFPQALHHSEGALSLANEARDEIQSEDCYVLRALAKFGLGDVAAANSYRAAEFLAKRQYSFCGVEEAECRFLAGDRLGAETQTRAIREFALRDNHNSTVCRSSALLARLLLPDDPLQAERYLQDARTFADRCGHVELQLRCFHAACKLCLCLGDYTQAIAEAEAGILLADTRGFGKYSIELRLALAESLLAAGDARQALQNARGSLDRSEQPDCAYACGQADGLHFCGLAHLRLGERELACRRLTSALELCERLGHRRIEETRRALELCRP